MPGGAVAFRAPGNATEGPFVSGRRGPPLALIVKVEPGRWTLSDFPPPGDAEVLVIGRLRGRRDGDQLALLVELVERPARGHPAADPLVVVRHPGEDDVGGGGG